MSDRERYWKVLNGDGSACRGGSGKWPLPHDGKPGEWIEVKGELVPCQNGLHLCRRQDLLGWLGPAIYEVEYDGERVDAGDKIVVRRARLLRRVETWTERSAREFAADCAEAALLGELAEGRETDKRLWEAVEAARAYARGEIGAEVLAAAGAAAGDAALAAAGDAAGDAAAGDAAAGDAAAGAAAAGAAAWDAAWAAAWDAAWAAAAWAAARAAAGDAMTDCLFWILYPEEGR